MARLTQAREQQDGRAQVMQAVQEGGFVSRRLFEAAYASKKAALKAGDLSGGRMGPFWDRLVFSKVKARLGGAGGLRIRGVTRPLNNAITARRHAVFAQ